MDWLAMLSAVLGIVAIIFGVKLAQVKALIKEMAEALAVLSAAVEDNDITRKELEQILSEFKDVVLAALKLVGKA
jgi:thiamine monophosphate synthase